MSESRSEVTGATETAGLDGGTYEVLRARLAGHAAELAGRAEALNDRRVEVFGGAEFRLAGTERIRTEHSCVPRDIVSLGGDLLLFGYNVFLGPQPATEVADVFSVHRFTRSEEGFGFDRLGSGGPPGLLADPSFGRDFAEIYRYYRQARLLQLRRPAGRLLAVFQIGPQDADIRVLRWRIDPAGMVSYEDNRGERDQRFPPAHDFEWTAATREDHVPGRHPHVSIDGEVFVETVGGTLTVKIENNTETGAGIYSEPVDEPLQSLADADVRHARVGALILLRIRPYNETGWRHLVFNTRTKSVVRLDGIAQACRRLPEDQGIIFPGGYYLDTGVAKTFDTDVTDLEYERAVRSPNGEDVLYVFHARGAGRSLLLHYNVIRKRVATPITCHGHSLFDDGTLVVLRAFSDEPGRVHPVQVWRTPFASDAHAAARPAGTGPLDRVGNADLVRGISECLSIARMVEEMSPTTKVYEALIAACVRAADFYHWLGEGELGDLRAPLAELRGTAEQVLAEYEKVRALTGQAAAAVSEAAARVTALVRRSAGEDPGTADGWVDRLAELRRAQGGLATLRERRYVDAGRIDEVAGALDAELAAAGRRAVDFLRGPDAFAGYHAEIDKLAAEAAAVATVARTAPVAERLAAQTTGLEVVTEVVGTLDIADATVRTAVLERVGEVMGALNRARAALGNRRRELLETEGRAAFAAEFALLDEATAAAIGGADTERRCDERLGRLLLRLEDLESRFGELDGALADLETRRADIYEAFAARRQALLDDKARRAGRLGESAERMLGGLRRRAAALTSLEEINTFFATDAMVTRLRAVGDELRAMDEPARAEELAGRVAAARRQAARALRDRLDLYGDDGHGGGTIRLGRHRFAVNAQPIELTLVPHGDTMAFAITATDYRSPVRDPGFAATREFWGQSLVSETPELYRAEYLAAALLDAAESEAGGLSLGALHNAARPEKGEGEVGGGLLELVRTAAAERYDEGYERGVHDHDTAAILGALLELRAAAGLLRYPPGGRALAQLFWAYGADEHSRAAWSMRAVSLTRARRTFGGAAGNAGAAALSAELAAAIAGFAADHALPGADHAPPGPTPAEAELAGEYLVEELAGAPTGFVTGQDARELLAGCRAELGDSWRRLADDLRALGGDVTGLPARRQLAETWLRSYAARARPGADVPELPEAVAVLLTGTALNRYDSSAALAATAGGLLGTHPRIARRRLDLRLDELPARARRFRAERVPAFRDYQRRRNDLIAAERSRLKPAGIRPEVMSTFVRNRLLDEVYLPLVGDNLARQLGAVPAAGDAGAPADRMGLLLLVSPPGYGKTTLMEYVAERLGLAFVKIDGPALGGAVTSLDPAAAPDAAARQEVEKINLALAMGTNVLLHVDDIQHVSAELLQKFIPLCDAQRRVDGVWEGRPRSYDLRGRRFAVCMAGNPYTGSGRRFQIPDMLANRADVWNLGDVLSGRDELFALSYIENALTANPVLAPLPARDRDDLAPLLRLAAGDRAVRPDRLAHPYPRAELDQILAVLGRLLRARDVVLAVNRAYIASAAQADASRTEPPFRLQGSYRDMNALAGRIVPVMNDRELAAVIDDHYLAAAQTLTSDAEANLLKLAELRGTLTARQAARWAEVKAGYLRERARGGNGADRSDGRAGRGLDARGGVRVS